MNNNDNRNRRVVLGHAAAGLTVGVLALFGTSVTPAAADRVVPEDEAATELAADIVESVLEQKLKAAADRVARPGAYGSTWRG